MIAVAISPLFSIFFLETDFFPDEFFYFYSGDPSVHVVQGAGRWQITNSKRWETERLIPKGLRLPFQKFKKKTFTLNGLQNYYAHAYFPSGAPGGTHPLYHICKFALLFVSWF
jgi:hypothetical protein